MRSIIISCAALLLGCEGLLPTTPWNETTGNRHEASTDTAILDEPTHPYAGLDDAELAALLEDGRLDDLELVQVINELVARRLLQDRAFLSQLRENLDTLPPAPANPPGAEQNAPGGFETPGGTPTLPIEGEGTTRSSSTPSLAPPSSVVPGTPLPSANPSTTAETSYVLVLGDHPYPETDPDTLVPCHFAAYDEAHEILQDSYFLIESLPNRGFRAVFEDEALTVKLTPGTWRVFGYLVSGEIFGFKQFEVTAGIEQRLEFLYVPGSLVGKVQPTHDLSLCLIANRCHRNSSGDLGEFAYPTVPSGTYFLDLLEAGKVVSRINLEVRPHATTLVREDLSWIVTEGTLGSPRNTPPAQ
ncbi:MAG: hypothetical protein A2284_01180 [Deltaproteobacteria bacterium RIFOXYA12_FULL_61_11]|nr:MAG: hypothetical protein A2284_01180 [Deltaproteobacteria bacterium RIFOXYA12_FULL_61_11]